MAADPRRPDPRRDASLAVIEESLSLLARRASLPRVNTRLTEEAQVNLDWYAYIALYWIAAAGPLRLSTLAHHFGVVPSTVCRHVQALERNGLVERAPDPTDGRANLLSPSEEGERVLADLQVARRHAVADAVATWSPDDVTQLASLLDRLRHDLGLWGLDEAHGARGKAGRVELTAVPH